MPKNVLLTLGRLPKALALARALHGAGYRVVIAEPFRWHVCKPSRSVAACYRVPAPNVSPAAYLDALEHIIRRESIDLVLPVSEEALHVAELHGRLPADVTLLCPPPDLLFELHDKLRFTHLAEAMALPVPTTCPADTAAARELAANADHVLKPAQGCSGIGLEFRQAGMRPPQGSNGVLVQRRIAGRQVSTLTFLRKGRILSTVCYEGTVFAGTVAVCFQRVDNLQAVKNWVDRFCENLDYSGFIAFDFIIDAAGTPWAIECNPRVTSGVHFLDESSLGHALSVPGEMDEIPLRQDRDRFQWGYSTLTEAYACLFRPREFIRCLREMVGARDVVWSARDPLPFLLMTPMSWEILWPAMTTGISLGEATQRDIAKLSADGYRETGANDLPGAVGATGVESGR